MGKEQEATYYNKVYNSKSKYINSDPPGAYVEMWETISQMIDKKTRILDLGCGVGQFALFLKNKGFENYTGIDFSKVAIDRARSFVPEYRFENFSFYSQEFVDFISENKFDIILCLETLEHIRSDLILLTLLPKLPIVFSVPTFDDKSHVRWFKFQEDIMTRYQGEVKFQEYYFFKGRYHLIKGVLV